MQFNTVEFFIFLPLVLLLYYSLKTRAQNVLLVASSYLFYGWWDWRFLGLLLLSTIVDFCVARGMKTVAEATRRNLLVVSLLTNLGILAVFKYFGFFVESFAGLLNAGGLQANLPFLQVALPVGISFYTFQTLAYTIDVYRRKIEPTDDLVLFALYVSFFPQLVAGPIERAQNLLPQFRLPRKVVGRDLAEGTLLIFVGLLRKVAIADVAAEEVNLAFSHPETLGSVALVRAVFLFALQIYGDFSGYSDIARGSARLMGIELMVNFQHPYLSSNITEFWRRWHISLSTWLRDYLYIPLGGNRKGQVRTYINLMLTMLLGGLWHGAKWTFVVWGGLHGVALIAHRLLPKKRGENIVGPAIQGAKTVAGWALTMGLVGFAWIFFRSPDFSTSFEFLAGIFAIRGQFPVAQLFLPAYATAAILLLDLPQVRAKSHTAVLGWALRWRVLFYVAGWVILLVTKDMGHETFIYFQF